MKIRFDYEDNSGTKTTRTISAIWVCNEYFIRAYCELRQATRSFAIGRMASLFDAEKNVPISDIYSFLGMVDDSGEIKAEYLDYREDPVIEMHCQKCGIPMEIRKMWALENSSFLCECGQSYTISKEKKGG